eukprot:NODE_861_length_3630_cov_0.140187.p1 type:complete len:212 gc:universal NODE_861_length_3630_cov_0.140187:875-240(-)
MIELPISIVILGSGAVGKSSIVLRYIRDSWADEYDPTIEDSYVKKFKVEVDGQLYLINLEITDTAGQENYRGLWGDRYLRDSDAFILVYSVCELDTLHELNSLAHQIFNAKEDTRVPVMVVGNKRDLTNRQVTHLQGSSFTKQISHNAMFMECSAKTGDSVHECFDLLVRKVIKKKSKKDSIGSYQRSKHGTKIKSKKASTYNGGCTCSIL